MKTPILGSAYVARSLSVAANRMVNLFPEVISEGGKEPAFLNRAPGLKYLSTVGTGPIRGMRVVAGHLYVVSGQELHRVDDLLVPTPGTWVESPDNCGIASVSDITGSGEIVLTVTDGYQFTVEGETWPETPSPWSTIVAGSPHTFTIATITFDDDAPFLPDAPESGFSLTADTGLLFQFEDDLTFEGNLTGTTVTSYDTLYVDAGQFGRAFRFEQNLNRAMYIDHADIDRIGSGSNIHRIDTVLRGNNQPTTGSQTFIWCIRNTVATTDFVWLNQYADGRITLGFYDGSQGNSRQAYSDGKVWNGTQEIQAFNPTQNTNLNDDQFYVVTSLIDMSNRMLRLYINGVLHSEVAIPVGFDMVSGNQTLALGTIGPVPTSTNYHANFDLASLRVREVVAAPSDADILNEYQTMMGEEVITATNSLVGPTVITELLGVVGGYGPVSMADNVGVAAKVGETVTTGTQLFIACDGPSYIYDIDTEILSANQETDPDYPDVGMVGYLDGYFVFNESGTQKFWITSLLDGRSVNPLDFASAEGSPDGLVGLIVDHRELWLFGTSSSEVWYNSGAADFPFERRAFLETGCAAPHSVAKLDNGLFWLGDDGIVYRANGYIGHRISTHAVEWQIQQCGDLSGAVAYTYTQDGHSFYVLTVPGMNTTWVYDVATEAWHERAGFSNGSFTRHRSNCQAVFDGNVIVGDYENGNVYALDLDTFDDNGSPQKWLRSWRALGTGQNNFKRTAHHSLQLDCEAGVGLNLGQGSDPEAMLRWSDDGGHTWSNEHRAKMGAIGQYGKRVIWRRLGMTMKLRDRVYEVSGTDPVKIVITGAELIASGTNA